MRTLLLAAATSLILVSGAYADDAAAPATFCGTVQAGVEAGCLMVKGAMVGAPTYNISSARPKPHVGWLIAGTGKPGGVSTCMQGTVLTDVKWKHVAVCALGGAAH